MEAKLNSVNPQDLNQFRLLMKERQRQRTAALQQQQSTLSYTGCNILVLRDGDGVTPRETQSKSSLFKGDLTATRDSIRIQNHIKTWTFEYLLITGTGQWKISDFQPQPTQFNLRLTNAARSFVAEIELKYVDGEAADTIAIITALLREHEKFPEKNSIPNDNPDTPNASIRPSDPS